jgi:nitrite reductase/ring-hydroxylating ferredoxin subunit
MDRSLAESERFSIELNGTKYQLPKHCTHRGGRLKCGYVNARLGRITCPLHGATFDIRTGKRVAGPVCPDLVLECSASTAL